MLGWDTPSFNVVPRRKLSLHSIKKYSNLIFVSLLVLTFREGTRNQILRRPRPDRWKLINLPAGKIPPPSLGRHFSVPPNISQVSDPCRVFWADTAPLYLDGYVALPKLLTEIQGHCQVLHGGPRNTQTFFFWGGALCIQLMQISYMNGRPGTSTSGKE